MRLNYYLVLIVCLIISNNTISFAQKKSEEIATGKLFFSKIDFQKSKIASKNYTDSFTLHKDKYLSIHFTLDKPLIESLKLLAPNLTDDQLLNKGNFQFSIIVDGKKIHTENLNKGARTVDFKTKKRKHFIPLMYPEQIDFWGWFMWMKFMKLSGGQDVLVGNKHSLIVEVRPYIKTEILKVGPVLAKGNITVEVDKIPVDESLIPIQNIESNSGWELSKSTFNVKKIEDLNRKIAEKRFEDINGIVVIKDNKLLIEEYFNGETRNSLHDARSVGKSFASTVLGIAIKENYIQSENVLLKDFYDLQSFKNYSKKKDSVTLKSLLTMSSGFVGDDSDYNSMGNEEKMYPTNNWVKFSLNLPMEKKKKIGKDFSYFTAGVVVLGNVIHKSVPKGLVSYAEEKLFKPLNITNYKWQFTPQKVGNTAGGIQLRAIDFAKYGQLYKNKGMWNGEQILTKEWVDKSLSKQVSQINAGIENGYYGYLFWNKEYKVEGKSYEVSFCSGRGGNKVFIFKDIPFVVVITSSAYNNPIAHLNADKIIKEYILPAVIEKK